MLIACLRIDERTSSGDHGRDSSGEGENQQPQAHGRTNSQDEPSATGPGIATPPSYPGAPPLPPPDTAVVEFMGGADAKAEELVVLTGASSLREVVSARNVEGGQGRRGGNSGVGHDGGGGGDGDRTGLLELRGGVWEHIGLPRRRILDVLQWAQRQLAGAEGVAASEFTVSQPRSEGGGRGKRDGERSREPEGPSVVDNNRQRDDEEAAAITVARVTIEVLQGLLLGQLPRGFATRVINSRGGREGQQRDSKTPPVFSPAMNQPLDPFFMETPAGTSAGNSGPGGRSGAGMGATQRSRSRSWRNGQAKSSGSSGATSIPPPLCIRLPEAFPALCQQVAVAPLGAVLRGEAIETLVAAAQSQSNAECVLSVDCWQQYLLSVVSSAQGRQAMATAAAVTAASAATRSVGNADSKTAERPSRADGTADDGDTSWHDRRSARDEAVREERLVDRTLKLICWLAMCKARSGRPGRPGAGFAELQDTMSFLRCQGELGTMECMSVGEKMLGHMVRRSDFTHRRRPFPQRVVQQFCFVVFGQSLLVTSGEAPCLASRFHLHVAAENCTNK